MSDADEVITIGIVGYASGYMSLQANYGVYINAVGVNNDMTSINPPQEMLDDPNGNFYISGQNGEAVIKSTDSGSIHLRSKNGNVKIVADKETSPGWPNLNNGSIHLESKSGSVKIAADNDASIDAVKRIGITTPGECHVSVGSPLTMFTSNLETNILNMGKASHASGTAITGAMTLKTLATTGKAAKDLIMAEKGSADAVDGLKGVKGGVAGLAGIAASFLNSYTTMVWGGISSTSLGNNSSTTIGNASRTVIGLNSETYLGATFKTKLGPVAESDLAVTIKSGLTWISNKATKVKNYFVSAEDGEVKVENAEVKVEDAAVDIESSEVAVADSDVNLVASEITIIP